MCVAEVGLLKDQGPTASVKMEGRFRTIPLFSRAKQGLTRLRTAGVDLHSTSSSTKQTWDACDKAAPMAPWLLFRCSKLGTLLCRVQSGAAQSSSNLCIACIYHPALCRCQRPLRTVSTATVLACRPRNTIHTPSRHIHATQKYRRMGWDPTPCSVLARTDGMQHHRLAASADEPMESLAAGETPDHRTFSSANRHLLSTN